MTAEEMAHRKVRHAGWFKVSSPEGGTCWKKVGPDLSGKIAVRQAIKQPDGKYFIPDVDVFYPNKVKGEDSEYTADKIRGIVSNTNAAIESGSQPPGLIREHPKPEHGPKGAYGTGFNFRESDRGPGWVSCDLNGVDPLVYDEWRKGRWIGLSAGFAADANSTNMRFGHIALLGADMQALSRLPLVEVYSTANQLCFSTDQAYFQRSPKMAKTITPDQKAAFAALREAHEFTAKAFASYEAGEDGADDQMTEAEKKHKEALEKAKKAQVEGTEESDDDDNKQYAGTTDGGNPLYNEHADTVLPEGDGELGADGGEAVEPDATIEVPAGFSAKAQEAFSALQTEVQNLRRESSTNRKVITALIGKNLNGEFSAFVSKAQADGHQFDAGVAMDMFTAVASDPQGIARVKKFVLSTPKNAASVLADAGQTFAAGDAGRNRGAPGAAERNGDTFEAEATDKEVLDILGKALPHMNFSASDLTLGRVLARKK
jgi:hypothetical protein